jgi:hypothetical protein
VGVSREAWVTVRIEEEPIAQAANSVGNGEDLLFGMWRDREDMADVGAYIRKLRASRYRRDGLGCDPDKD